MRRFRLPLTILVLVAIIVSNWHGWGPAAVGGLIIMAMLAPIIWLWRVTGRINFLLFRRDR